MDFIHRNFLSRSIRSNGKNHIYSHNYICNFPFYGICILAFEASILWTIKSISKQCKGGSIDYDGTTTDSCSRFSLNRNLPELSDELPNSLLTESTIYVGVVLMKEGV